MKHLHKFNEGRSRSRYDGTAGKLVKNIFQKWMSDFKKGKTHSSYTEDIDGDLVFDIEATLYFTDKTEVFQVMDSTGVGEDDDGQPFILIDFVVNPGELPEFWHDIYMILSDVVRHEIEHLTQDGINIRKGKPSENDEIERSRITLKHEYLLLPKEIDANLQGLRYEAKKRKESMADAVNRYLDIHELDPDKKEEVLSKWRERAKKISGIPNF